MSLGRVSRLQLIIGTFPVGRRLFSLLTIECHRNKEILNKIASDLEKAFHCEFDDLSRYFMSMCLNGKDKKRFEERQTAIERIQDKYNSEYTDDDSQQSASDVQDNPTASLDEVNELVVYRDKFLDDIFQRCLRMVLVIANDSVVKNLLGNLYVFIKKSPSYTSNIIL